MRRRLVAIAALATMAAVGCDAERGDRAATDGPLIAQADGGGTSLDAPPRRDRWTGILASLLCSKDGAEVEIKEVVHHFVVEPIATRDLIRKVPELSERTAGGGTWDSVASFQGSLAQFRREYRATSLETAQGAKVSSPCIKGLDAAFTELVTVMTTDERGGWIDKTTVVYSHGEREYEVAVPWTYITCGSDVDHHFGQHRTCPRRRSGPG